MSGQGLVLKGLKVLDLTRLLPGPLCTMLLGDYGAEVIKVEDPASGDPTRAVGEQVDGIGAFFRQLNRNKKSICLNLKTAAGKEIFRRLAVQSDVLVEGFRPGVMQRLGLGYEQIREMNPGIVYASISGYGQEGPYRERAGHDLNYAALAGLLELSAAPGEGPVMPSVQIADIAGGSLNALSGIMMALFARAGSGKGAYVDISMTRGLLPWLTYVASYLNGAEVLPRRSRGHITGAFACYNLYETADGKYMSLGALEPAFWQNFCLAVKHPDWALLQFDEGERLKLIEEVQFLFKEKSRDQWVELFSKHDACCEAVLALPEAVEHPLSRDLGFWLEMSRDGNRPEKQPGFPLLFSGSAGELRLPPPRLGEHTANILRSLGYDDKIISALKNEGAIMVPGTST
jgi:crotonobetainyl-CoA:carnitine CoA-transferase CaiB-like acyl-CoA transferase